MNPSRVLSLVVAGCCLLLSAPLLVADPSPFAPDKQYSADMVTTTDKGQTVTMKMFTDSGKVRSEISTNGMQIVSIVRPDQKKVYSVMVAQKMVMAMPYDADKYKSMNPTESQGKVENLGPDTVEGVACTKYKMTTDKDNKVFFMWADATTKAPVKMMAEDNSFTIVWKNYKVGPQDAALFEPPADYKMMDMPAMPSAPPSGQ